MSDEQIERAIEGVLAVANSNFPSDTDIMISTAGGKNTASVRLPSYVLTGIITLARKARTAEASTST